MKILKTLLQSRKFYCILICFLIIYVIFFTKIIKYKSIYNNSNNFYGKVLFYKIKDDKLTLEVKSKEKLIVDYYLENGDQNKLLKNISINSKVKVIGKFVPLSNNTIPNTFNYKKYLYNKKIYKKIIADKIIVDKKGYSLKNNIIKRINKYKRKDYLYAFILGDKSYLDMTDFQKNGISHLFAISGLHVSFVLSFLEKRLKIRNQSIIFTLLFLYAYIVSFSVGVLRVVIFKLIKLLLKKFNILIANEKILLLTMAGLILINPFYIYDYGFIFSFAVSFCLIICNISSNNYLKSLLLISVISFLASLPINIILNNKINLLSILNNLFFVPIVSYLVFPISLLEFIFSFLEPVANVIYTFMDVLNKIVLEIPITFPQINYIFIFLYYFLLYYFFTKRKFKFLIIIFILMLIVKYSYKLNNDLKLIYFDVNQGDSSLIAIPSKNIAVLLDTGGNIKNDYNINNIITYLYSLGITKLSYLIISHGDFDHMGEAINLVENFKVENVIFNCGEYNDLEQKLIKVLDKKKIKYYSCIKELNIDKYKLQFLNTKEYDNENDNSSVIYFNYNNYKSLFMGDAGISKEKDILDKYNLKDIDFLKVGHHGSNTSSSESFINSINPKYSLISVGKNNRYGHPKDEVLETLKNSKIYRTDLDGSIEIKLNKNGYKIRTCPP